jgi:hypothetical protein
VSNDNAMFAGKQVWPRIQKTKMAIERKRHSEDAALAEFAQHTLDLFASFGKVELHRMFGGSERNIIPAKENSAARNNERTAKHSKSGCHSVAVLRDLCSSGSHAQRCEVRQFVAYLP